jgi:hypothetical protein
MANDGLLLALISFFTPKEDDQTKNNPASGSRAPDYRGAATACGEFISSVYFDI